MIQVIIVYKKRGDALTIYLDIIFLENLCINCIILLATTLILKKEYSIIRILLSSLIGSLYAVLVYLSISEIFSNFILKILLSICMVYVAYNSKNLKVLLKQLLIFYLTSFTFGGVAFALLYFIKPQEILVKDGVLIGTYPIKIALAGVILGFIIITFAFRNIKKKFSKKDMFCNATIFFEEKSKNIRAMIDTGNLLKEPLTGSPVIVVQKNSLQDFFPQIILDNADKIVLGNTDVSLGKYASKFRVIPFTSLGKENGLLLGIKVDSVQIEYDDLDYCLKNAVIGIYDKKLTKNDTYCALVGISVFEENSLERNVSEYEYIASAKK